MVEHPRLTTAHRCCQPGLRVAWQRAICVLGPVLFVSLATPTDAVQAAWADALPMVAFASRPRSTDDRAGNAFVWAAVRVVDGASRPVVGVPVRLQVRGAELLTVADRITDITGVARIVVAIPSPAGDASMSVSAHLPDLPAATTREVVLSVRSRVGLDVHTELSFVSAGLPRLGATDQRAVSDAVHGSLVFAVRPRVTVPIAGQGTSRLEGFAEVPFITMTTVVLPAPSAAVAATARGRVGIGDPTIGLRHQFKDVLSVSTAINGRSASRSLAAVRRLALPDAASVSDAFIALEVGADAQVPVGKTMSLFASVLDSEPLAQRLDAGTMALADRRLDVTVGIGSAPQGARIPLALWFAHTTHGGVRLERAARSETVLPKSIDRVIGVTAAKERRDRTLFRVHVFVGGLGTHRYLGVAFGSAIRIF